MKIIIHVEEGLVQQCIVVPDGTSAPQVFTCYKDVLENGDPLRLFPVGLVPFDDCNDRDICKLVWRLEKARLTKLKTVTNMAVLNSRCSFPA